MMDKPFPWRPGMLTQHGERVVAVDLRRGTLLVNDDHDDLITVRMDDGGPRVPDPTDGATCGALLDVVRQDWDEPHLYPAMHIDGGWVIERVRDGVTTWLTQEGTWDTWYPVVCPSEWNALMVAREMAP